jgi:hypothetical protein
MKPSAAVAGTDEVPQNAGVATKNHLLQQMSDYDGTLLRQLNLRPVRALLSRSVDRLFELPRELLLRAQDVCSKHTGVPQGRDAVTNRAHKQARRRGNETKRNQTKPNETKRNQTKRNQTKPNLSS